MDLTSRISAELLVAVLRQVIAQNALFSVNSTETKLETWNIEDLHKLLTDKENFCFHL